jgi:signal transduction histidine kinase
MKKTVARKPTDLIANLPWGTHCCNFYKAKADLLGILTPYFKAGLLNNELCLWVTASPLQIKDAIKAMRLALPRFDSYLNKGQMEIYPYNEWYLKNGVFSSRSVLNAWIDKCGEASAKGYEGLRLTGNAFRLQTTSWKKFVEYEAEFNRTSGKFRIKALCTYSWNLCRAYDVRDVVKNHGYALIRRGAWEHIENSQQRLLGDRALERAMMGVEKRVKRRTTQLRKINNKLMAEIADCQQAEKELQNSREQLRALAAYLQSVREEERTSIARELHDEIGQALTAIKLALERNVSNPSVATPAELSQTLTLANKLIGQVRDLSLELRPAMLDDLGLLAALRWHIDRYAARTKVTVNFKHRGLEKRRFSRGIETTVYRIAQEALTNIARHGKVDQVAVEIVADENSLRMAIQDPGLGFDRDFVSARATGGLFSMRERAMTLGGRLTLDSSPSAGTVLTAELPLISNAARS